MRAQHGAGIAAPQIGVSLRVVIFEVTENPRYPHVAPVPYTVLINPIVTALDAEEEEGWKAACPCRGCAGSCRGRGVCAIKASISPARLSTALWRISRARRATRGRSSRRDSLSAASAGSEGFWLRGRSFRTNDRHARLMGARAARISHQPFGARSTPSLTRRSRVMRIASSTP